MDPNANLKKQEELIELRKGLEAGVLRSEIQRELKELRVALVGWLRGGGFAPQWATCPKASAYYGHDFRCIGVVDSKPVFVSVKDSFHS